MIEAHQAADETESGEIHEEPADGEFADEIAFGRGERLGAFGFGACVFEEFCVIHARGAGGHAGEAAETKIHFLGEGAGGVEFVVGDGAHERDAAAGTVAFELGRVVSGAGGEAKTAVHALLHDGVIEFFEK